VATLLGDLMAHVESLAEVEYKQEQELAPVPNHLMEERTAAVWDPLHLPENAILTHAQVSCTAGSKLLGLKQFKVPPLFPVIKRTSHAQFPT